MCGRFTNRYTWRQLHAMYRLTDPYLLHPLSNTPARYNVAPTQEALVIRLDADGPRENGKLEWGPVPYLAKDASGPARLINAQCETAAEKASFRSAYRERRCLVIADGWYEWETIDKDKIPYFFSIKD